MTQSLVFDVNGSGVSDTELAPIKQGLADYQAYLQGVVERGDHMVPEASLCLPSDEFMVKQIEDLVGKYTETSLKYVVVIGIGGSNLGTLAFYEALFGTYDMLNRERSPKLLFLDTTSEEKIFSIIRLLERECVQLENLVINIISKSGGTTETVVNFELLYTALQKKFGDIHGRVVVTTDEGSTLWERAHEKGFARLSIPKNVGGRYSVFSSVGLFPLGLAGVSIRELLDGAKDFRDSSLGSGALDCALTSASIVFHWYTKNITINNSFFFAPELESVGKWYRQLMGESLGKEHNILKQVVHTGITPIVSIGSTDLHSMAQLYFGGPRDKFTTIINVQDQTYDMPIPQGGPLSGLVPNIEGKTAKHIMDAIVVGVRASYTDLGLPFITVTFPAINAYTLGAYMQYKMLETMYLAHCMSINAFDQPNVEHYKIGTKKALENE